MLNNLAKKIFGTPNDRYIKKISVIVEEINKLEDSMKPYSQS